MASHPCTISFPGTDHTAIILDEHQKLSDHLTVQNSPVLFGCRTGICGTCLVMAIGHLTPPSPEEQELLDTLAPGDSSVRLACQIEVVGDLEIKRSEG